MTTVLVAKDWRVAAEYAKTQRLGLFIIVVDPRTLFDSSATDDIRLVGDYWLHPEWAEMKMWLTTRLMRTTEVQ